MKFNVTVTASSCDSVFIRNGGIFNINVPGFGNVEVDFEGICSCECSELTVSSEICICTLILNLQLDVSKLKC